MAKAKIITGGIVHLMRDGRLHTLRAGDRVPAWAEVTNPALFVERDEPDAPDADANAGDTGAVTPENPPKPAPVIDADTVEVSTDLSGDELRKVADDLGLSTSGSKPQLVARILAKRAEIADAAKTDDDTAGDDTTEDDADTGRAALEARARELGIDDFDENTSDDELEALIEDQE